MSTAAERLAALKARVAAAVNGGGNAGAGAGGSSGSGSGNAQGSSSNFGSSLANNRNSGLPPAGGLNVPLHPALENLSAGVFTSKSSSAGSRQTGQHRGDRRHQQSSAKANPYLDNSSNNASMGGQPDAAPPVVVKARQPRQLIFNQKGKYIQMGIALRRQADLENLKKRIAEQARRAGMDEIPSDKNFVVEKPPDIEWVDQGYFADSKSYADLGTDGCLLLEGEESIVTDMVQHPIPIEPPQEKLMPAVPKPLYLTKKEQKRIRRQRRMAELKEKQAKIRLGLMPAPPPKVKRSNLMRVLGEEAVQDPTAVEARVNREIAERHQTHMQANEERKLTKEQRHQKLAANQEKDAAKGIHMLIFKVPSLANAQYRFKIWKNAEQLSLTGVCVMHPKACLIVVEGGEYSTNKYRKLMLNRIDWTQNIPAAPPAEGDASAAAPAPGTAGAPGPRGPARAWLASESETLPNNQIQLIFDGETKARNFRKWTSKICDTDREAFDFLARQKLESFWTQARSGS